MSFKGKYASQNGLYLIDSGRLLACAAGAFNGEVTIPDGVTSIGSFAFSGWSNLTSVTIPESVTSIGRSAFQGCTSLTSFIIPDSVISIGDYAISGCTNLTSITIPDGVSSIGRAAFHACSNLISISCLSAIPPRGDINMFTFTNDAPIYVPAESVDAYKSAEYWIDYAGRILAIGSPAGTPVAIDLGLSVKWASFNLGATKREEYGDYFAWGETEPYYSNLDPPTWKEGKETGYSWESYKWCKGSSNSNKLTKYCNNSSYGYNGFTDDKTVLAPEDDAAHMNLGGNWRMPTEAEWTELWENCSWTWTTQNGINGQTVMGPNGNRIFLPAAGIWGELFYDDMGSVGYYWSSSLTVDGSYFASLVHFTSGELRRYYYDRCIGLSVRPVCD